MSHARRRPAEHDPGAVHGLPRAARAGARRLDRAAAGRGAVRRARRGLRRRSAALLPDAITVLLAATVGRRRRDGGRRADPADDRPGPPAQPPGSRDRRLRRRLRHRRHDHRGRRGPARRRVRRLAGVVRDRVGRRVRLARRVALAHAPRRGPRARRRRRAPRLPWRRPSAWLLGAIFGSQSILFYGCITWLASIYVERGWRAAEAGGLIALLTGIGLVSTLAVPVLADRFGTRRSQLTHRRAAVRRRRARSSR